MAGGSGNGGDGCVRRGNETAARLLTPPRPRTGGRRRAADPLCSPRQARGPPFFPLDAKHRSASSPQAGGTKRCRPRGGGSAAGARGDTGVVAVRLSPARRSQKVLHTHVAEWARRIHQRRQGQRPCIPPLKAAAARPGAAHSSRRGASKRARQKAASGGIPQCLPPADTGAACARTTRDRASGRIRTGMRRRLVRRDRRLGVSHSGSSSDRVQH